MASAESISGTISERPTMSPAVETSRTMFGSADVKAFTSGKPPTITAMAIPRIVEVSCARREIGFGKTIEHNLELLRRLDRIATIGLPVVIGTSRKSFLGRLTGRDDPHDRVAATVATTVLALERGASVFRVHDVAPTKDALAVATATLRADGA